MRDNKPLELEALHLITYKLSKYSFRYSEPNYDEKGGDFFLTEEISEGIFKIIICQSKGRDITKNNSNLKINIEYLKENFLLFLYLKDEKNEQDNVFVFLKNDIEKWEIKDNNYYLNIPESSLQNDIFKDYILNKSTSSRINNIFNNINVGKAIEYKTITNVRTLHNLLQLWEDTGIRPGYELNIKLLEDFDNFPYINLKEFIFLLCITVCNEQHLDSHYSIDWAFQYFKSYNAREPNFDKSIFKITKTINSTFNITYKRTYLNILGNDASQGFLLKFGDNEETFECYILRTGEYSLKYCSNK